MDSFYNEDELKEIGFKSFGTNVLISKKASIYGASNITIGSDVRIDDFCILSGKIDIGNHIHISAYAAFFAGDIGITIKSFAGISSRCTILAISDDFSGEYLTNSTIPNKYRNVKGEPVIIEKHVAMGASCVVLPGVKIGEGAGIGAASLVNKNCEAWGIYGGTPARFIKSRSNNLLNLEELLKCEENNNGRI